jgi:cellulose synthase/poly-beta-1,6-N-acetylglucosamine synthase-like glycosyltransferase
VRVLEWFLIALVLAGSIPPLTGAYQFILATFHRFRRGRAVVGLEQPRVAIVIPAWNEAAVLERTIDRLFRLDYPPDRVRVYVVDDASTDDTPELLERKSREYPGFVHHLRREHGGEGKAHTINHGLREIEAEGWYEAVMIIDADVIFTELSLLRMTRHFDREEVGAVTAYIKEGSRPENFLNRFVAFEYVTAQAAARRAQNVLGAHACLAGGAQLVRRASLEEIGGQIDTTTLAEDTVTTFRIQLAGQQVVFEPHAIVWAEEPRKIGALWKQRLRWGRGNVQVTKHFAGVWFRRWRVGRLGGLSFALIWFAVTLMPLFMIASSIGLVTLYFVDEDVSGQVFRALWGINLVSYVFITLTSFSMDPSTARRAWREGVAFPGAISLLIILYAGISPFVHLESVASGATLEVIVLFVYVWLSASMVAAYLVKRLEDSGHLGFLVAPLLYVVGYGPLLCAMTAGAYIKQLRGAEMKWDKTEKTGAVGELV